MAYDDAAPATQRPLSERPAEHPGRRLSEPGAPRDSRGYGRLETFFVMPESPCPYLPNRQERKVVAQLTGRRAGERYSTLSRAGFRRSHLFAYRPACHGCEACVPVRVRIADYRPSRNLKRIRKMNGDLTLALRPALASEEQYALFRRYLSVRHRDGEMAAMTAFEFRQMVDESAVSSQLAEFRRADGTLVAGCIIDWVDDGVSAVYSFFEPELAGRSLGTAVIDRLILEAGRRGLPYAYLGYWIEGARKMDYKTRFRPLEGLQRGAWGDVRP